MKRILALLLALAMVLALAACGGKGESEPDDAQVLPGTEDITEADQAEQTADTVESPEEPEIHVDWTGRNPLTGEAVPEDISNNRPVMVMLNNLKQALPQSGNSQADIIYEILEEGGITRMLAVYQDISSVEGNLGTIRSTRPYYVTLVASHDGILVHAGGSGAAYDKIEDLNVYDLDALNRLGDCYYNNRNFDKATNCYNQVIAMRATGADYATFQCGYSFGLMRQYKAKMNKMQNLVINYPNSDFADDALYELARAALESEDAKEAIKAYKQLFNSYPNSPLNCKASLEYAMIYHATRDFPNAIDAFKHTIETYSGTDEAYMALEGLQQVYIETNNINEYLVYSKKLPQLNMNVTSQEDSLIYITAELQYMKGNYEEAVKGLTSYINLFCSGGRHCTAAYYYTADSYYRLDEFDKALTHFQSLVKIQGNPFMEQAYTRIAEILFDKEDYQTAMFYFKKMQSIASNPSDRQVASIGVLRCSRNLNDNNTTIEIATDILTDNTIDDELRNEAMYSRAKAYLENNNSGLALGDLVYLAKEVRTSIGAESKYMLAQVYFNMNNIKQAEEEVMDFTQMNTSQQYWLAKSLILLSDIYVKKGDTFQAKQYLISLQNNYKKEDDIQLLVLEKIQQIDILEKPQPTNSSADDLSSETV